MESLYKLSKHFYLLKTSTSGFVEMFPKKIVSKFLEFSASTKKRTRTLDQRKKGPVGKNEPQGLSTLPFFSSHMEENVEVIYFHFHVKSRGERGLVFVQIMFGKCTTNFYFENGKIGIKTSIANWQSLLVRNVSICLPIFVQLCFQ